MIIVVAVAVAGDAQVRLEVNWQSMRSPLAKVESLYVLPLPPTTLLFFFHTNAGDSPPLTGVAANVTSVPAQMLLPTSATVVTEGLTVPVIVTVATLEFVTEHAPLVTRARKYVVTPRAPVFKVAAVWPLTSLNKTLFVEDCHWIVPTKLVSLMVVPLPLQRDDTVGVAVPPTEVGLTVTTVEPATEVQLLTVAVT